MPDNIKKEFNKKLISIFYENNPKNEIVALMKEKTVLSLKNEFL
jgi:hypothetical protein